jgi:hypothetical protein
MTPKYDSCRSCGASVIWTETILNKRAPVDATPTLAGNIILGMRHGKIPLMLVQTKQKLEQLQAKGELLYTNHFVTCPDRQKWRKR